VVFFSPWRDAVVSSSSSEGWSLHIDDELTSVLAFGGQHAFALGTTVALAERSRFLLPVAFLARSWQAVACSAGGAAEDRLSLPSLKPTLFQIENDDDGDERDLRTRAKWPPRHRQSMLSGHQCQTNR
jgi:hypothetical protein